MSEQAAILESEVEMLKQRLVELRDAKENLQAQPNLTAPELESIEQLQEEIATEQRQMCKLDEQLKELKQTLRYQLEKKTLIAKSTCDQMEDTMAQLRAELARIRQVKQKLETNAAGTEQNYNLEMLTSKMREMQETIKQLERQSTEAKQQLDKIVKSNS